jgi:LuxR family maltose regulon positive regulatory protein
VSQTREPTATPRQVEPLLTTKLFVPPLRPDRIPRSRLLQRLDAGLPSQGNGFARKLTLVSAPAGYGKTTLLAEWVARMEHPVAWLSVDDGDDDPVRFLAYLTAALTMVPRFTSPPDLPDPGVSGEATLTVLLNQAARLAAPVVLVLDDVHRITAPAVHDLLAFLLDNLPPTLHLVIATRADPPLPIARLRARGQLTEIRQTDLCFSHTEAAAFLRQSMALDLTPEDVAVLADRTEGWIAGLQMAAVSMRQRDDLGEFVRAFAGSHRYVMDYLMEEVLRRQPAELQTFLLQTSILDQLCGPLCDAVSSPQPRGGSQSVLEHLDQANLFVTPLDDRRTWYRYHRLFADLLQRQLTQRYPELIPDLHRRASTWYEDEALLPESIEHALAAGDFERAANLIEQIVEPLMMRSEVMTLRKWLDALPGPVLAQRPGLSAYHAWLLLLAGEPLCQVESRIDSVRADAGREFGQIQAARALIALFQGQADRVIPLTEAALKTLTDEGGFWHAVASWLHSLFQIPEAALRSEDATPLKQLIQSQLATQNVFLSVMGLCNLGELRLKQGRLHEAEKRFDQALTRATDREGQRVPIAGVPLTWLGELARERNELPTAEARLTEGIERISEWGPIAAIDGYLALARLRQAQGDHPGATAALDEADRLAVLFDATEMDDHMVAMARARIAALQGDFAAVERWVESRGLQALDPDELRLDAEIELHLRKYELAVLALARILERRPREALPFLEPLLDHVADKGRWGLGIEALALQAAAYHLLGETGPALTRLERALARAEPEGYVQLFVEIGEPMAQLLYQAAERDLFPEYAGRLLAAFPEPAEPTTVPPSTQPLIEPLSERELEVLSAIAAGLSNQETARRLYISERTVKWHASNIYGKLQVSNRTEAVAKARSLGILPK